MLDDRMTPIVEGMGRQHTVAAFVAAGVSIAIHVVAIVVLMRMEFEVDSYEHLRPSKEIKRTRIHDVYHDTMKHGRPHELGTDDSSFSLSIPEKVSELAVVPGEAALEPVALLDDAVIADSGYMAEPSPVPELRIQESRREILMIEERIIRDNVRERSRKIVPRVERTSEVRDTAGGIDRGKATVVEGSPVAAPGLSLIKSRPPIGGGAHGGATTLVIDEPEITESGELFAEKVAEISGRRPIEEGLVVDVATYTTVRDRKYGYFRIQIRRDGESSLPVIPKDIVFVQDCSASMAEQRLYFCRQGLTNSLQNVGSDDRFNVISFRDTSTLCFPDWVYMSKDTMSKATDFIAGMKSEGNTDIFASVKELMKLRRSKERPMVVFLITDGRSTTGMLRSSDIIGEFSKLNEGRISIFAMGTTKTANMYLLDLLSYSNRGGSGLTKGGRWGIPGTMSDMVRQISRPVMADVSFRFAARIYCEVYPVQTSNLYLDRPLVVYGRYPRNMKQVVFQAVGTSGDQLCDMVFNVGLEDRTRVRDKGIRREWARQKIYYLLGKYARSPRLEVQREIHDVARRYGVDLPHRLKAWSLPSR